RLHREAGRAVASLRRAGGGERQGLASHPEKGTGAAEKSSEVFGSTTGVARQASKVAIRSDGVVLHFSSSLRSLREGASAPAPPAPLRCASGPPLRTPPACLTWLQRSRNCGQSEPDEL